MINRFKQCTHVKNDKKSNLNGVTVETEVELMEGSYLSRKSKTQVGPASQMGEDENEL